MFKFLKDKLKNAVKKFSKDAQEEVVEEELPPEEQEEQRKEQERKQKKEQSAPSKTSSKTPKKKTTPPPKKEQEKHKPVSETVAPQQQEKPVSKSVAPWKKERQAPEKKVKEEPVHVADVPKQEHEVVDQPESSQEKQPAQERKGFFSKMFKREERRSEKTEEETSVEKKVEKPSPPEEVTQPVTQPQAQEKPQADHEEEVKEPEEKRGIFSRISESITKKTLREDKFEELFFEIELALLENNVSIEVIEKIKEDLKQVLVGQGIKRGTIEDAIMETLRKSLSSLFDVPAIDILEDDHSPHIIMFIGVNGSGKTTTLAKVAHYLKNNAKTCVIAACDTFRAAAIQQLEEHADNVGVKVIKHDYGADPAAVAYDAIEHAKAKKLDVVLIDTAGRLHSNTNLMDELRKVARVAKPHTTLFVGESITGNDCVEQAVQFGEAVSLDGIVLTKADVDEKGGAAISISYVTKKPIVFIGMGQGYDDLKPFDKEIILSNLGI